MFAFDPKLLHLFIAQFNIMSFIVFIDFDDILLFNGIFTFSHVLIVNTFILTFCNFMQLDLLCIGNGRIKMKRESYQGQADMTFQYVRASVTMINILQIFKSSIY